MNIYLEDIIDGFLTGTLQDIEDSFMSLFTALDIDAVEGVPLRKIADMVGLNVRSGDTNILRSLIKGQAAGNVSNGTVSDVDAIAQILFGSTVYTKEYRCAVLVVYEGTLTEEMRLIYKQIFQKLLPAGVGLIDILVYNSNTARYDVGVYDVNLYA